MKPKHFLFGLFALMAASCTNDDLNEVTEIKQNGIQVTAGLTANTRVNFEQDGSVTHALWEEGDQITLYAPSQGYLPYQVSTLSEDAASATFTPINDALQNTDETIYAAHRADMEAEFADGMVTLPNTDRWTDEHPLPFAYAISKVADGKLNLSFEHVFAYLKLTLNAETVAGSTNKSIAVIGLSTTSDEPLSNIYGFFNIPEQEYVIEKGSNHMFFSLQEPFTATGTDEKSVYIPILPQSEGATITINIYSDYEANDCLLTVSKEVPSTGFIAGHAYTYSPQLSFIKEGNTITLIEAGTLSQAISATAKDTITSLKIIGPLNGDDIRFIREMAGRDVNGNATEGVLTYLDISEASIVAGGGYYFTAEYESYYTENNEIGWGMFYYTILKKILLPKDVTSIGAAAFYGCSSLTAVYISDLSAWCRIDFEYKSSNPLVYGGKLYLNNVEVTELIIPDDITKIKNYAFFGCSSLTSINIPDGVTSIGSSAFSDCSLLENVTISSQSALISIGHYAFYGCSSLASINIPDGVTEINSYAFTNCSSLASINIPDAVTSIGETAFYGCSSLTSINIPDGVTEINSYAFTNCSSLASINIPDGVTSIGEAAFYGCSSLTSVTLGSGLTWISYYAFENCSSLASINIPDGVTSIGEAAFSGCSSLSDVYISDLSAWCKIDFEYEASNPLVNGGKLYLNNVEVTELIIPDDITIIKNYAFFGCSFLTSINIPDGVTSIGHSAFYNCSSLTSIIIPDGVTSIGHSAFCNCSSLTSIIIPDGVTSIGSSAFSGCSLLENVTISSQSALTSIDWAAFSGCSSLISINIPDGVTEIGSFAFYGCSSLTSVTLGSGLTWISYYAFENCSSLTSINIPDGITLIDAGAFYECSSLTSINIPDGVTSIGYNAFYNCSSLTSIIIPDGVTEIGKTAFCNCSSLSEVTCNATTPPTLGVDVFYNIVSSATLYVPTSCSTAYDESDWAQYFTTIEEK